MFWMSSNTRSRFVFSMAVKLLGFSVMKSATWLEIYDASIPRARDAGGRYNSSSDNLKVKFEIHHIHTIFCFHLQGRTGGGSFPFNVVAVIRLQEVTSQRTVIFITSNVCAIVIFTAFQKCFIVSVLEHITRSAYGFTKWHQIKNISGHRCISYYFKLNQVLHQFHQHTFSDLT